MSDNEDISKRTEYRRKRKLAEYDSSTDTDYSISSVPPSPRTSRSSNSIDSVHDGQDGSSDHEIDNTMTADDRQGDGSSPISQNRDHDENERMPLPPEGDQDLARPREEDRQDLARPREEGDQDLVQPREEEIPEVVNRNLGVDPACPQDEEEYSTDDEIEIDSDGDEEPGIEEGPETHDPDLYRGAPITLGQSLLAILSFVVAHQCSGEALADLLGLIALHCILEDNVCVKTLYKFKKYFQNVRSPLILHYFCSHCYSPLQSKDSICGGDLCANRREVSYFVEISIISQLRLMFERQGFYDKLRFRFERQKKKPHNYEDVYDGQVYKSHVESGFLSERSNISFCWNSDGVRIFKSAKFEIWPFYLVVNELPYADRFKKENTIVAGLWFGPTKPALPLFLNAFHSDLTELYQGINVNLPGQNEQKLVRGLVLCGSCDTPAKSHFLNMINFNGYYGCPKCKLRGERSERTEMNHVYPYADAPLRTMLETTTYAQQASTHDTVMYGVKGMSALSMYVQDYITSTSVDVMHCVFQGVSKTLLKFWFDEEFAAFPFSLHAIAGRVNDVFVKITPPSYIRRLPRSLFETLKLWKAAEFKSWLFYYSVPVLTSIMTPEYFNHHMLLVHGIYLLNQSSISRDMVDEAERCLKEYVAKFQDLYGYRYLSINFHLLLHLAENVRQLGPLWATSCMPFEDLNGQLKRLVHGTTYAALQITSSLSQIVSLPVMLAKLDPNNIIRVWCEQVLEKKRLPVNESITDLITTVGKYVHCDRVPPLIGNAFINANIDLECNMCQFFRLKRGKLVFYAESYGRILKTMSSAVKFHVGNATQYGIIQTFVRKSECNCNAICRCPALFYAILSTLQCASPFNIAYPRVTLSYIHEVTSSEPLAVPIVDLDTMCVCVKIGQKMYIIDPVNTLEDE